MDEIIVGVNESKRRSTGSVKALRAQARSLSTNGVNSYHTYVDIARFSYIIILPPELIINQL